MRPSATYSVSYRSEKMISAYHTTMLRGTPCECVLLARHEVLSNDKKRLRDVHKERLRVFSLQTALRMGYSKICFRNSILLTSLHSKANLGITHTESLNTDYCVCFCVDVSNYLLGCSKGEGRAGEG